MNKQLFNIFKGLWMVVKTIGSAIIIFSLLILGCIFGGGLFNSMGIISISNVVSPNLIINWIYGIACLISMVIVSLGFSVFLVHVTHPNKTFKYYSMYYDKFDLFIKPDIMNGFIFIKDPYFLTLDEINKIKESCKGDFLSINGNKININRIDIIKYKSSGSFYKHFVDKL